MPTYFRHISNNQIWNNGLMKINKHSILNKSGKIESGEVNFDLCIFPRELIRQSIYGNKH